MTFLLFLVITLGDKVIPEPPPPKPAYSQELLTNLDNLAHCESRKQRFAVGGSGNYKYYSYFQWHLPTWYSLGNEGMPWDYSYEYQRDEAAQLQLLYGWGQWPGCAKALNLL